MDLTYLGVGGVIGAAHWALLWGSVRLLVTRPRGLRLYGLLFPVRWLALAAALGCVVVRGGAVAGLAALAGVAAARWGALRLARGRR